MSPTETSPRSTPAFHGAEGVEVTNPTAPPDADVAAVPPSDTPPGIDERVHLGNVAVGQVVRGRYRVGRMLQIVRAGASSFWVVHLADRGGTLTAYGWPDKVSIPAPLSDGTLVDVEFLVKLVKRPLAKLFRFDRATNPTVVDQIATLPMDACPIPGVVNGIYEVVKDLQTVALQRFLAHVFDDYDLALRFFRVPASFRDHHSEQGGMARHCLEGARILRSLTWMEDWMRELAIVYFLVHDIGKTWTNSKLPRHFECYHLVEHDDLSLEILAAALQQLDLDWPDGGIAIRHCLTCASPGARYGKQAAMPIAEFVRAVDRISQLTDLIQTFGALDGAMKKLEDGRRIWQPAKP
jgi:3'-5' exoribonuclease